MDPPGPTLPPYPPTLLLGQLVNLPPSHPPPRSLSLRQPFPSMLHAVARANFPKHSLSPGCHITRGSLCPFG